MSAQTLLFIAPIAGVLALVYAWIKASQVNKAPMGTEKMVEIAGNIREGAMAFLSREYKVLAIFVGAVAVLLGVGYMGNEQSHSLVALSFVVGAVCSALAGFIGMRVATAANVRTTNAARKGLNQALAIAFGGGSVMGMSVVGLGTLGLGLLLMLYLNMEMFGVNIASTSATELTGFTDEMSRIVSVLSGFSLGASSIALFARVGGGIYTKAADVGADLVGKVEAGIPEDDPRNPATIADNVGDNVGDVAGMGADLFESYVGSIVGAMVIGATWIGAMAMHPAANPGQSMLSAQCCCRWSLAGVGIVVSMIGTFFVKTKEGGNPQAALNIGTFVAAGIMALLSYVIITNYAARHLGRFAWPARW